MKLGLSMWSYVAAWRNGQLDTIGFIEQAAKLGVQHVELLDFFYKNPEQEKDEIKKALEGNNVKCSVFSVSPDFAKAGTRDREIELEKIKFGVDEALFYGAKIVRVFAGDLGEGISYDDALVYIIDGLTQASEYAKGQGVQLALENHGKLAGRADQVKYILESIKEKVGPNIIGANVDTGNFLLVDQDSSQAVDELAKYTFMVHFKDFKEVAEGALYYSLNNNGYIGTVIGEGDVDLVSCLKALKQAGFSGPLNLEYEGLEDPMTAVPKSLQNTREAIEKICNHNDKILA